MAKAELAVPEYTEGRFVTQMMTLEKDLAIAESNLRTAQNMLAHAQTMSQRGYVSALDLERSGFAARGARIRGGVLPSRHAGTKYRGHIPRRKRRQCHRLDGHRAVFCRPTGRTARPRQPRGISRPYNSAQEYS